MRLPFGERREFPSEAGWGSLKLLRWDGTDEGGPELVYPIAKVLITVIFWWVALPGESENF
jgi:hypothetical protein